MEKNSWIVTLVAGAWLAGALALPAAPAGAADRRADPTRLNPNYWPQSSERGRQGQTDPGRAGSQANYHADYHLKTGTEPPAPRPGPTRDARDERADWPISPDRPTLPFGWRH